MLGFHVPGLKGQPVLLPHQPELNHVPHFTSVESGKCPSVSKAIHSLHSLRTHKGSVCLCPAGLLFQPPARYPEACRGPAIMGREGKCADQSALASQLRRGTQGPVYRSLTACTPQIMSSSQTPHLVP